MILYLSIFPGRINVIADSLSRVTPLEFQDSNAGKGYSSSELYTVFFSRRKGREMRCFKKPSKTKKSNH